MWHCPLLVAILWAWGIRTEWKELPPLLWDEASIQDDIGYPPDNGPSVVDVGGGD